jgi:hypothetical protein
MYGISALGLYSRPEGVPIEGIYYFRATSLVSPVAGGLAAGVGGASIARFGWADADGRVTNARASSGDLLGLVVSQGGDWRRIYWDMPTRSWKIREGMNLTMLVGAPGVWVWFPGGARAGLRVYTSPLDGVPVAGDTGGLEPTPWVVGRPYGPGGLSLITTWNPKT